MENSTMNDAMIEAILAKRKFTHIGSEDAYVKQVMYYRIKQLQEDFNSLNSSIINLK